MSSANSSRAPRSSLPASVNDVASRMAEMDLRSTSDLRYALVTMPEARVWAPPPPSSSDGKPLPSLPNGNSSGASPLPPRVRPPHLSDRPNPYDLPLPNPYDVLGPIPKPSALSPPPPPPNIPPPMLMPSPNHWEEERPSRITHSHSDPPPSLRPGYIPPLSTSTPLQTFSPPVSVSPQPPRIPQFNQHSPSNRPSVQHRYSNPATPSPATTKTNASNNRLSIPGNTKPNHGRSSSAPPSPTTTNSYDGGVQCSGVTKTGKRCTRAVKSTHPYNQATSADDGEIEVSIRSILQTSEELCIIEFTFQP